MAKDIQVSVLRIALDEARKRRKQLLFVDARSATALARDPEQIPDAVHVPLKHLEEAAKGLPRERAVVTYCT